MRNLDKITNLIIKKEFFESLIEINVDLEEIKTYQKIINEIDKELKLYKV